MKGENQYELASSEFGISPLPLNRQPSVAWSMENHVLSWTNVSWEVDVKKMFSTSKTSKVIVHDVSGKVQSGQVFIYLTY